MKRISISDQFESVLESARRIASRIEVEAVVLLADVPYDFAAINKALGK